MTEKKSVMRTGTETPVKSYRTFPLADRSKINDSGDTAIPAFEDVRFVKEFGEENEK
ncbi:MAG: hypothetical protein IJ486_01100 [Firmicutes bacterium]|nr:hypothetical protein [Bacillota bacterium]